MAGANDKTQGDKDRIAELEAALAAANEATGKAQEEAKAAQDAAAAEKDRADKAEQKVKELEDGFATWEESPKESRGETQPGFMAPDYNGPLTADQAQRRHDAGLCEGSKQKGTKKDK